MNHPSFVLRSGIRWVLSILPAALILIAAQIAYAQESDSRENEQMRTEIPYRDGVVKLTSDTQEIIGERYRARGNVRITYKDIVVTGDEAEYNKGTSESFISGHARFSQNDQWLACSRAEFNFSDMTGAFYDASGYTDKEFLVSARAIFKTGPETYRVEDGFATTCQDKPPKWSFQTSRAEIRLDHTARMRNTVFKIKGVPVFYMPYLILPTEKKERNSGFVPFHTGTSTTKGRMFSEGYYQTLGRSSDMLVYGDYFTLRGLAVGGIFRTRPNPETRLTLQLYGINDRLDQGGMRVAAEGESRLKNDWRAVVHANIYSNFAFRQAFAEDLQSATIPTEKAIGFLTRNHKSFSTNIAFARDVVLFPGTPLITKKTPSLEFTTLETSLGPFNLNFRAALEGLSRSDSLINTGSLVQRMDVFPRVSARLPAIGGFSITPSVGFRETWYGARRAEDTLNGVANEGFHRRYFDMSVEVKTPVLEKDFQSSRLGDFRHSVEPQITWRKIDGIKNFDQIIRFDQEDAIADTNEIEYGIFNRFFTLRQNKSGSTQRHEFMSLGLVQKYYFDPAFGGVFESGQSNSFYPLNSVTGFYQTGIPSNFSPISTIFRLSPQAGIHNDIRADFDVKEHYWRNASFSTLWEQGRFFLSGTWFMLRPKEVEIPSGNHIQGQIGYGSPTRGVSTLLTVSYNLRTGRWLNSNTRLSYTWDCCSLGAEVNQYDLGLRTESRISFSFTLKGIGNFGNIRGTRNRY